MRTFITSFFLFVSIFVYGQTVDSIKVVTPIGQTSDTLKVRAVLDLGDVPLFARNYLLITKQWVYDPNLKLQPTLVERYLILDTKAIRTSKFTDMEKVIWMVRRK